MIHLFKARGSEAQLGHLDENGRWQVAGLVPGGSRHALEHLLGILSTLAGRETTTFADVQHLWQELDVQRWLGFAYSGSCWHDATQLKDGDVFTYIQAEAGQLPLEIPRTPFFSSIQRLPFVYRTLQHLKAF